jgi:peptidoglycan/xylan/chitin deacetylase (PgdA/CDA1 family)
MEANNDEGDQATFVFYRPLLLLLVLMACSKSTRKDRLANNHFKQQQTQQAVVKTTPPARKKKKKKIYLTFDDGPNKGTRKVLDIVQQEQVPVTFFLIGEHVFASTSQHATWDSLRVDSSIELCNHSHTHAWNNHYEKFYEHPDSVVNDFKRCRDSLQLGNDITRTPGRNIWRVDTLRYTDLRKSALAADSLQQAGFSIIGWDLEWHYDHKSFSLKGGSDEMLQQIDSLFAWNRTRTPENLVLLAHDQVYDDSNDSAELHQLIKKLKARDDYELVIASNYPGVKKR